MAVNYHEKVLSNTEKVKIREKKFWFESTLNMCLQFLEIHKYIEIKLKIKQIPLKLWKDFEVNKAVKRQNTEKIRKTMGRRLTKKNGSYLMSIQIIKEKRSDCDEKKY